MYSPPFRIIVYNIHDGFSAYKVSYSYDVLSYKIAELYAIIGTGKNKRQKQKRSLSESWTNFILRTQTATWFPDSSLTTEYQSRYKTYQTQRRAKKFLLPIWRVSHYQWPPLHMRENNRYSATCRQSSQSLERTRTSIRNERGAR